MHSVNNVTASTNNDMIYIHIIITICVAILAAFITHLFALRRERKSWKQTIELQKIQEYSKAAAIFRSNFTETLFNLNHIDKISPSPNQLLSKSLPQFEKAKIQFVPYLSGPELENLNASWNQITSTLKNSPGNMVSLQYRTLIIS